MSLDAAITETGRVLADARRLYGSVPAPGGWATTGGLLAARDAVVRTHGQALQFWRGTGGESYSTAGGRGVHALDLVTGADEGTQPGLTGGATEAARGRAGLDTVITNTRNGVAALAPSTATPAGRRELIAHLQGELGRAKDLLRVSQQRNLALSVLIANAGRGYRGLPGAASPMAAPMGLAPNLAVGRIAGIGEPSLPLRRTGAGRALTRRAQLGLHLSNAQGPGPDRVRAAIRMALDIKGIKDPVARARWESGMMLVAQRESGFRSDAVNTEDVNAQNGDPSKGTWQFIGSTFRAYHEPGTSTSQTDDLAQACAFINYAQRHYRVSVDGSNLAANIQQADPTRPPRGY
uniref:Transglycosylase SLT domain protein n=1 Tax=Mycobacterium riyadhense TaxID=486698 RepID=A0A653EWD5_9MYCO|nr:Transglycosylase SLT domain protein [Mycobacterium riyadhense]